MHSLRADVREWRRAIVAKGVLPLTLGTAALVFLVAYSADLLAGAYVGSIELIPGWFSLHPVEHVLTISVPVLLLECVLVGLLLVGVTPLMSARLRWWTWRRWGLVVALGFGSGGALSNVVELLRKSSVTDFLLIHRLGDFSAGDFLMITGYACALALLASPEYVRVRKRHVVLAFGAVVLGLIAIPLIRPPLSQSFPMGLLVTGLAWLIAYFRWRISVGGRLLSTLATDVPHDPGPETDRVLEELELALQASTHADLAASAWALSKLANAYRSLGRPEDLRRTSDEMLRTAQAVNNDRMKAWALDYRGAAYTLEDEPAEAYLVWQDSLLLANQQGDDRHTLLLLANIAWAEVELDRRNEARRTYASALDLAERLGNSEMAFHLRHALANVRPSEAGSPGNAVEPLPPDSQGDSHSTGVGPL